MTERIRQERIGIEDHTLPDNRPMGSYLIERFDGHIGEETEPTGFEMTRDDTRYKEAVTRARSLTRENPNIRLTGPFEVYDPPALD